jgi:putative endonuclease
MIRHREGKGSKFCAKYNVNTLIWFETHLDTRDAIRRETQIKRWNRQWKIVLILSKNPEMKDLLEKQGKDGAGRFPLARE